MRGRLEGDMLPIRQAIHEEIRPRLDTYCTYKSHSLRMMHIIKLLLSRLRSNISNIPVGNRDLSDLVAKRHAAHDQRQTAIHSLLYQPPSSHACPNEHRRHGQHQPDSNEHRSGNAGSGTDCEEQCLGLHPGYVEERNPWLSARTRPSSYRRSRANKRSAQQASGSGAVLLLWKVASCISNAYVNQLRIKDTMLTSS
jgi:hypothetical protein